jgi:hypothetical protein
MTEYVEATPPAYKMLSSIRNDTRTFDRALMISGKRAFRACRITHHARDNAGFS